MWSRKCNQIWKITKKTGGEARHDGKMDEERKIDLMIIQETHTETNAVERREEYEWHFSTGIKEADVEYRKATTPAQRRRDGRVQAGLEHHGVGIIVETAAWPFVFSMRQLGPPRLDIAVEDSRAGLFEHS